MKRRIIITDNDKQGARLLKRTFDSDIYEVSVIPEFRECCKDIFSDPPDILIIDPLYPSKTGMDIIKSLSTRSECRIIAVSEKYNERIVAEILDSGADDYLKKPFFSKELLSRVRAAERRLDSIEKAKGIGNNECYRRSNLCVMYSGQTVTLNNNIIHLTKIERRLLMLLCRYSGKILTYDYIIKEIWGVSQEGQNGILRVNITNLRKKLQQEKQQFIITENGIGYRMAENEYQPDSI